MKHKWLAFLLIAGITVSALSACAIPAAQGAAPAAAPAQEAEAPAPAALGLSPRVPDGGLAAHISCRSLPGAPDGPRSSVGTSSSQRQQVAGLHGLE